MNQWTDEELGELLTSTFASREPLADPDVARRLASAAGVRRRRWQVPAYAAAAVVLVAGVAVAVGIRDSDRAAGPTTPSATPTGTDGAVGDTYAAHLQAARAEAARILALVALPSESEPLDDQPPGGAVGEESIGPSDPGLTRTAWWQVLGSPEQVGAHLLQHVPDGFTVTDGAPQGTSIDGYHSMTLTQTASTAPTAYRPAFLLLRWKTLEGGTVVRADVFIGAYDVRDPASTLGDVTSAAVSRTVGPTSDVLDLTGADSQRLTRLVDAFQGLSASMRPPMAASCPRPQPGKEVTDTITFRESGGATVVARLEPSCWGQVSVTRDGEPLTPTLDPRDLDDIVESLLREDD